MATSAKSLYEAGLKAYGKQPSEDHNRLMRAFAKMLAVSKANPRKAAEDKPKLPFSPRELYETVLERCGNQIACVPYDKRWFSRLGKELQSTSGLTRDDLESFVGWVQSGGLEFMDEVSFAHVIKHWGTWITKARQWKTTQKTQKGALEWML